MQRFGEVQASIATSAACIFAFYVATCAASTRSLLQTPTDLQAVQRYEWRVTVSAYLAAARLR